MFATSQPWTAPVSAYSLHRNPWFQGLPLLLAIGMLSAAQPAVANPFSPTTLTPPVFADRVIDYQPGSGVGQEYRLSHQALGQPDYRRRCRGCDYVSLGNSGQLILQFTEHWFSGSGDAQLDLWIFEIGTAVEAMHVDISSDGQDWISLGTLAGATRGLDLDAWGLGLTAQFDHVRLTDAPGTVGRHFPSAGADIDAIAAFSTHPKASPPPEPATAVPEASGWLSLLGIGALGIRIGQRRRCDP